jgi:hypothetical protein
LVGREDAVTDWVAVLASDFNVPPERALSDLMDELCGMLADADPAVRDDTAYPVLAMWTARGALDGHLATLGDRMAARLVDGEIQARTFATMILGWVVLRDARTGELDSDAVPRWRAGFTAWWLGEHDLRGWDDRLGWLHAVAHGADTVRAFGRSPRLHARDLRNLLDTVVDRLRADDGYLFAHGEDDRLAYALATILTRSALTEADAVGWLDRVEEAIRAGTPGPVPAWVSNTLRTLAALHMFADRGVRWYDPQRGVMGEVAALPHATAIKNRVAAVLGVVSPGLG